MRISVVIPTYNRPRTLLQALRSLQEQTLSDFEILVVDNAADSEVEKMVAEFNLTAKHLGCYVSEPQLGLHNARHTSARVAQGDIFVFTDDDATFDPGWLQAYGKAFVEHHEMAAAGGPVRPIWEASPPKWLLEFMGDAKTFAILSLMEPYNEFRLDPEGFFFGVNMAIRRNMGIELKNYQGPTENIVIKNNTVQTAYIGIGRYIGSHDEYPVSIDSDYNLVFDSDFPFRGTIISNTHDLVMDPGLVDPQNLNFALMADSPARDSGTDLTGVFDIDNHDAVDPSLPAIAAPIIRTGVWDIGAYEYQETQPDQQSTHSSNTLNMQLRKKGDSPTGSSMRIADREGLGEAAALAWLCI